MRTASNSIQRCDICGVRLSMYNDDILCFLCQEKDQKQTFIIESSKPQREKEQKQTFMEKSHKPLKRKMVTTPINSNVYLKNSELNNKRLIFSKDSPISQNRYTIILHPYKFKYANAD
jgi:hypothetical protein